MGIFRNKYVYTQDLLALEAHRPSVCPRWCGRGPTPLRLEQLQRYLHCHLDTQFASYIFHGLRDGFHIGFSCSSPLHPTHRNHPSALDNPGIVTNHLRSEIQQGRLYLPTTPTTHTSGSDQPDGTHPQATLRQVALNSGLIIPTKLQHK